MSNSSDNGTIDYTLSNAHGTVMVIAWITFASTGILFARYGRLLYFGAHTKFLGELIWFQIHRFALCMAAVSTLLGFFLILAELQGQWVDLNSGHLTAHSILGVIIVCCAQIQVWMSLFRCHPNTRHRYIFNWLHRCTGLLAFALSIPTIFLVAYILPKYSNGIITILSLWSAWVVIIVVIFEIIEYYSRKVSTENRKKYEFTETNSPLNDGINKNESPNMRKLNTIKIALFCIHIIIAICLTISLIVLIWMQS